MPGGEELPLPDAASPVSGHLTFLPVVPGKLEFAVEVRRRILAERPAVVAIELPISLGNVYLRAVDRLPQISVIVFNAAFSPHAGTISDPEESPYVCIPVEPTDPFIEAIRTAREIGAEVVFLDPDTNERPHLPDQYPDTYSLASISYDDYVAACRVPPRTTNDQARTVAAGMAWKLQGSDPLAKTLVVVSMNLLGALMDAMLKPADEPQCRLREEQRLVNPDPSCLGEILTEYPYLQDRYEQFRLGGDLTIRGSLVDRPRAQLALYRDAEESYFLNTGDKVQPWQRRLLARYSRNLARTHNELTASLFDITVAARSIVDENFAWEVWETATRFSAQQTAVDGMETMRISGDEVWLDTKRIHLRRNLPSTKRRFGNPGLRKREKEKVPGEWASSIDGSSICSYPPEDILVEDFGRYLKSRGKSVLSEERSTVEPFTSSLLDGVDLRETIRNWHEDRIWVRNTRKVHGEAGSVIVIFDEDRQNRYRYMTTWLGEHQNESDMAFYSTEPFEHMVGPGIGRAEYGGFLMSLPARRMYDVWSDPDYDFAETKAERLLLAGLDYSIHRFVVYVASKPPRSVFRTIAARFGRTIVYIPIGQLSPSRMKKIRVVHVLDSHSRREEAKQYLW